VQVEDVGDLDLYWFRKWIFEVSVVHNWI